MTAVEEYRALRPHIGERVQVSIPNPLGGSDRVFCGRIEALFPQTAQIAVHLDGTARTERFGPSRVKRIRAQPFEHIEIDLLDSVLAQPRRKRGMTVEEIARALGYVEDDPQFLAACGAIRVVFAQDRRCGFRIGNEMRFEVR
jgi:hypothetical protein